MCEPIVMQQFQHLITQGVRSTTKSGEKIMYDLEEKINFSVFPRLQGGPHNHTISAIATALKQAQSPEYKAYQKQVSWIRSGCLQ